jgi:WD40 repeat protein
MYRSWHMAILTLALSCPLAPADELPSAMDLCKYQTAIRNQGGRDVCPYFPPVAALEAAFCRAGHKVDLSAEHLIWLRNVTAGGTNDQRDVAENLISTLGGGNGMGVLNTYAVCRDRDLPYHGNYTESQIGKSPTYEGFGLEKYDWSKPFSQFVLNRWNLDPRQLPPQARANAKYRIEKFATMPPQDLKNPQKFEEILASEHEIIFTVTLHEDIHHVDAAQPVWRRQPGSPAIGNHFMLMVGYDSKRKFFIVKNQWGPTNYSAQKKQLAKEWKDIVQYDGYTLMDYNYLAECGEGHYITEVASIDSPGHVAQRALGQWEVALQHKDQSLMTGVLCWRRLPDKPAGAKSFNRRIGDLVTKEGKSFRVNADLKGDGTKPYQVTLHIDFVKGTLPGDSTDGMAWEGTLTLPEEGKASLNLHGTAGSKEELWGVPAAEVQMKATLVEDRNLLKKITVASEHQVGEVYHLSWQDEQQGFPANLWWSRFTPDGKAFLAGGDAGPKGEIRLWDVASGKLLQQFVPGGKPWFNGGLFLPDGKQLLTWYSTETNLFLWNVGTGKLVRKLAGPVANPLTVAVSPDGKRYLAGGNDKAIQVYDIDTGKALAKLEGHDDKCYGLFSPDGKWILTYSPDKTLRLWNADNGKLLHKLEGHTEACSGVFSPDSKQVLSYGPDKTLRLWDAVTGKAVRTFDGPTDEVTFASFLPGGDRIVAGGKDRTVRIWEAQSGKVVHKFDLGGKLGESPTVALCPDGRRLLISNDNKTVHILDLATGKFIEVQRYENATGAQGFSISPDGRYAATGSFRAGVYLWRLPD